MALTIAAATAGGVALAAYMDARFHIKNDLTLGSQQLTNALLLRHIAQEAKRGRMLLYHIFEDRAKNSNAMGDLTFLMFEGREWTYRQFYQALQPVGNWLIKDLGIERGEMVALNGGNSPEYVLLWLALEAIGATVAFINNNLTSEPLLHCVKVSGARYMLADADVRPLVSPDEDELAKAGTQTVYYDPSSLASLADAEPLPASRREGVQPTDLASLIYTSGTTGRPKGTVVTRARYALLKQAGGRVGLGPGTRFYTCLPLYHASAQCLACAACMHAGATLVLSRRFSHATFWPEVRASRAAVIQYVGELCRYLLNAPADPLDAANDVRVAWGNGLRPDIWEAFRARFGIDAIYEFYASTDGVGFLMNASRNEYSRGAIAIRGPLWHLVNGAGDTRVRIDPDTQDIARGGDGFAIRCKTDEAGEAICRVDPQKTATPVYHGNPEAGQKRLARDVFKKGDVWFRTGDAMRLDAEGRLFFVDRLGDTFRWRSENVSTTEVGDVVGAFAQIAEANVYGVLVPNADGRAGCAAVVAAEGTSIGAEDIASGKGLDLKGLAEHCLANLPRYAVPIFLRVVKQLEYTATMKLQKGPLRSEGIDLDVIEEAAKENGKEPDTIYWLPPGQKTYVPFTRKDLQNLKGGKVQL
ncbi:fatty acid transporter [Daldinia caldariorum]|uniref:fatty acid transporter n=1 Tax=Daldinia caldariorum TaxID=326644 RepID=UPI002008A46A|nr:fatty acid transporter [Daldinia caldariorum]KAI1463613.1 fatty acid transporter [Daldinia caldariorum]